MDAVYVCNDISVSRCIYNEVCLGGGGGGNRMLTSDTLIFAFADDSMKELHGIITCL